MISGRDAGAASHESQRGIPPLRHLILAYLTCEASRLSGVKGYIASRLALHHSNRISNLQKQPFW